MRRWAQRPSSVVGCRTREQRSRRGDGRCLPLRLFPPFINARASSLPSPARPPPAPPPWRPVGKRGETIRTRHDEVEKKNTRPSFFFLLSFSLFKQQQQQQQHQKKTQSHETTQNTFSKKKKKRKTKQNTGDPMKEQTTKTNKTNMASVSPRPPPSSTSPRRTETFPPTGDR